jgi:hypothetical protein
MEDAIIEVMAEASPYTSKDALNSFYTMHIWVRSLPANVGRNFSGFLVMKDALPF